ncbi:MAG: hypothetical protein JWP97_2752 [Labilithrix sp.]|nr:hypothetical protein [Labilithrix sp.]
MKENLPNEPGSWDEDFSYAYLGQLYAELVRRFRLGQLGDAPALLAGAAASPIAFIRHDVDVSLRRAAKLARQEIAWGARSTYHVMTDSPFYDVGSAESRQLLAEIASLGHEVGLHYDVMARGMRDAAPADREADIGRACDAFSELLGAPVRSVSFHLPVQDLLRGPLTVAGRTSGYAEDLFRWYLSDSRARWREGPPIESLDRPRGSVLQILVHPEWWAEGNVRPELRLREIVQEIAKDEGKPYEDVRDRVAPHIIYRAADL